jgi:hypothetical protein
VLTLLLPSAAAAAPLVTRSELSTDTAVILCLWLLLLLQGWQAAAGTG